MSNETIDAAQQGGGDGGAPAGQTPRLALSGASKSFGAVHALRDATLELYGGHVRALLGENGAGKSTLVKTLAGVYRPDAGTVLVDGEPTDFHGPLDARDKGIAIIYQEPTLFPDLTVAENVFMGRQPLSAGKRIDKAELNKRTAELFRQLGVAIAPERPVRGLSIADQQLVEIAKALSFEARVLIMDEPTAALSGTEVERLFRVTRTLREQGAAIMFISHRLEEIFAICDHVTVMRDGAVTYNGDLVGKTSDDLVRWMVGRDIDQLFPKVESEIGKPVLRVERLTREGVFFDVSFEVKSGEILALSGLVGAGRSEVARAIFGIDRADAGHVELNGKKAAELQADRGDEGRHRLRPRGPPPAGPRDGPVDRAQRDDDADASAVGRRHHPRRQRRRSRASGRPACSSSTTASTTPSGRSPAATSRRSCWRSGWRPSRDC